MPGFPIRTPSDLSSVDSSPRLIAASYVLHRLLMPRHPPCALNNLTTKMLASTVQFSNNHPRQPLTRDTSQTLVSRPTEISRPTRACGMTSKRSGTETTPWPPNKMGGRVCSLRTQQCVEHPLTTHSTRVPRHRPRRIPVSTRCCRRRRRRIR